MKKKKKKKKSKKNISKDIKLIKKALLIFFVGAFVIIGGTFLFINNQGEEHNVEVEINIPEEEIVMGVPFTTEINIQNRTSSDLKDVELKIDLGFGLTNIDLIDPRELVIEEIGEIAPGSLNKRTFKTIATEGVELERKIDATLYYTIGTIRFETNQSLSFNLVKSPISIEIEKPEEIVDGSEFELSIKYKNQSDIDFNNLILETSYPSSFDFISSNLEPESLNNRWILGALRSGFEGSTRVRGVLKNSSNSSSALQVRILENSTGNEYLVEQKTIDLKTSNSPIGIDVSIDGEKNYVASVGESLVYRIRYSNNSGISLRDIVIEAEMNGDMFDFNTLETNTKADFSDRSIIWSKDTTPSLKMLEPGEGGTILVGIALKNSFPITRLSDKNFTLNINTSIESPSVPYHIQASKTSSSDNIKVRIKGLTSINAEALYRDPSSGVINEGEFPPRVGEKTQYTVYWIITNHSTDINNTKVTAKLPENVEWNGVISSNVDTEPTYNESSREIVWEIPKIQATKGIISLPIEAIFQIEATPTESMVNQYQPLMSETNLTTVDNFTGATLISRDNPLSTDLIDDLTTDNLDGVVR